MDLEDYLEECLEYATKILVGDATKMMEVLLRDRILQCLKEYRQLNDREEPNW